MRLTILPLERPLLKRDNLMLLIYTRYIILGEGVDCYSNDQCNGSAIDTGITPQECCSRPFSVAHQNRSQGEVCKKCVGKHSITTTLHRLSYASGT